MKHLLLLLAAVFALNFSYAQSYQLDYGKDARASLDARKSGSTLSSLRFAKQGDNTQIGFNFSGINASTARVQFYSNGKRVYETTTDANSGGPSVPPAMKDTKKLLYETTVNLEEDDSWWIIVAAVVLCCVEAEVGSDGWSVGFDCDCLEGATIESNSSGIAVTADGRTYEGVTAIKITPVDGEKSALGGASIASGK